VKIRPETIITFASYLALVAAFGLTAIAMNSHFWGGPPQDFLIFYRSSIGWLSHGMVYAQNTPNMNAPTITWLMAPLGLLSAPHAAAVWWALSLACLVASVSIAARESNRVYPVLTASLVLITEPGFANIRLGQIGLVVMLPLTLAWAADRKDRASAGAWLGLTIYMKPFLLVLLAYLGWRRSRRAIIACVATMTALAVLGIVAGGVGVYRDWIRALFSPLNYANSLNASFFGLLSRMFESHVGLRQFVNLNRPLIATLSVLASALVFVFVYGRARNANRDVAWAALIFWSILASPLGWVYYMSIGVAPLAVALHGRRAIACVILALYPLILFRFLTLQMFTFGRLGTVTLASVYMWSLLLILFGVLSSEPDNSRCSGLTSQRNKSASKAAPLPQ
jgi:hypothetical protein